MINLKTPAELGILRAAGRRLAEIMAELKSAVRPGMSTAELDLLARQSFARVAGDQPAFLNYQPAGAPRPFPSAICVSINDEIVHGAPRPARRLAAGDIVSLDVGLRRAGWYVDMAVTVPVGEVSAEVSRLLRVTEEALQAGIKAARPGGRLGDIGAAVWAVAERHDLGVVRELGGHGVGRALHEPPLVPNYGRAGEGLGLKPGLVLAIEPMFTLGRPAVKFMPDGYLVTTRDGSWSAHFEHTVAVTPAGPEVLTRPE